MGEEPARKKAKLKEPTAGTAGRSHVGLYAPFRALGLVSTAAPFAVQSRTSRGAVKPEFVYATVTGDNYAIWAEESLKLKFVGERPCPKEISSVQLSGNMLCAASHNAVFLFERGKLVGTLKHEDEQDKVGQILVLGNHIAGLETKGRKLWIWSTDAQGAPWVFVMAELPIC